jgi:hypothetical protein
MLFNFNPWKGNLNKLSNCPWDRFLKKAWSCLFATISKVPLEVIVPLLPGGTVGYLKGR